MQGPAVMKMKGTVEQEMLLLLDRMLWVNLQDPQDYIAGLYKADQFVQHQVTLLQSEAYSSWYWFLCHVKA